MKLTQPRAQLYIPDGMEQRAALDRTTHLAIGTHQDDLEIMAPHGIIAGYRQPHKWFTGVVVTDGRGSPRTGRYADITDDDMPAIRDEEQCAAARLGEYAAQFLLAWPSASVKLSPADSVVEELAAILDATRPQVLYTHNLADKHDTHVAVALRVIAALRMLPPDARPRTVYGCEVWRGLDWMLEEDKVALDCSGHDELLDTLIRCFDSQLSGGKRYDLASAGRRIANATYRNPRQPDESNAIVYAMDLTPLAQDDSLDPLDYTMSFFQRVNDDVRARIQASQ